MTDLEPVAWGFTNPQGRRHAQPYEPDASHFYQPLVRKSDADAIARERDAMRDALREIRQRTTFDLTGLGIKITSMADKALGYRS